MLRKVPSGVRGLDEITGGGLPAGRPTLVCGGPGSGKTLLAIAFLAQGALRGHEPGLLVSFDESIADIEVNHSSLGLDLADLRRRNLIAMDHVRVERQDIVEAGDFDLEGLFVRIDHAVRETGARRVVLDSIDSLFASIPNEAILRAELRRLFGWLRDRELSTIITAERGQETLTRHGIEEYASDCVISLDSRINDELATRRLRVVKYRGSAHGVGEYPFLIDSTGIVLIPITSMGLAHAVSDQRLSTGIVSLDQMLEGKGYYKGSSVLVSGGPGTGKTSLAAHFARATAGRGERCVYFAFEESERQLVRNMRTIGVDLQSAIDSKSLTVQALRPTVQGLEPHLSSMLQTLLSIKPEAVVVDPLSALQISGTSNQSSMMAMRLMDFMKAQGTTAIYTTVTKEESTELNVSSLMDTWISVRNVRRESELERQISIVKSRGMAHSVDVRRFSIGDRGLAITPRREGP